MGGEMRGGAAVDMKMNNFFLNKEKESAKIEQGNS